ncbi:MAG: cation:proton antiporter [Armatimonadota bacterium]
MSLLASLSKPARALILIACLFLFSLCSSWASGGAAGGADEVAEMLLSLIIILAAAKIGGELFVRLGQPSVLGEIIFGMLIGNIYLTGFHSFDFIKTNTHIEILAEIGVVLLLFHVGLESDLSKMVKVGASSIIVATLGVIAPFLLGFGAAYIFLPNESIYGQMFVGATLCATSVGITARVLLDLRKINTPESRIILGAAVIDDVQGLVILAVVSGIIKAVNNGGTLSILDILFIIFKAVAFLGIAIYIGRKIAPKVFTIASRLKTSDLLLATALGICFLFAYSAKLIGLAPIVGAFAAGLILDEIHWKSFTEKGEHSVEELITPLVAFLAPIFFVYMGAKVNLLVFKKVDVLGFAAILTICAIIGKQVCSFGVREKGLNKLSVGIGMIPRGEVGLIFAAIGKKLYINGAAVISPSIFGAIVIMVVITTMITPPALKWSTTRFKSKKL